MIKILFTEFRGLPMKWKFFSLSFILWPVFFLFILGCGTVNESYLGSVESYSKPILKHSREQLNDPYNPMWFQRAPLTEEEASLGYTKGKPLFDKPISPQLKKETIELRERNFSNLERVNKKARDSLEGK